MWKKVHKMNNCKKCFLTATVIFWFCHTFVAFTSNGTSIFLPNMSQILLATRCNKQQRIRTENEFWPVALDERTAGFQLHLYNVGVSAKHSNLDKPETKFFDGFSHPIQWFRNEFWVFCFVSSFCHLKNVGEGKRKSTR